MTVGVRYELQDTFHSETSGHVSFLTLCIFHYELPSEFHVIFLSPGVRKEEVVRNVNFPVFLRERLQFFYKNTLCIL